MRRTRGADVARRRRFREGGRPGAQPRARGCTPPLPRCACALAEQADHAPPPRGALLDRGAPPWGGVAWGRPRLSARGQRPSGSAQVHTPPAPIPPPRATAAAAEVPHQHQPGAPAPGRSSGRARTAGSCRNRAREAREHASFTAFPSRGELTQARTPALAGMPTRVSSPVATHMSCDQDKVKVLLG